MTCLVASPTSLTPVSQADIARVMGAYCFIQLDNGDEAFYHHGHFVTCADAGSNEPSIVDIARQAARAGGMPLQMFELPLPVQSDEEWCWNDVAEKLARNAMTETVRASVVVTGCMTKQGRGIHFCSHPLLSGINSNLWIPIGDNEDWFAAVERVLIMNGLAENLTDLAPLRDCEEYTDWKATYNRKVII
ncbi:hypothetical protein SAMN03159428_04882 [Kosakonia radicincitans]|uniref:Uncharacterized protein n=1 Tax=Kosakonia radicincitans TaxID=283686 RepID=A0AAX2EZ30_9ENTR|nr:hypothetical protein [Kosakonia radicincitans]SFF37471.1 hypothetical protein SAMN03159468_04909 [Kosakonia radicincitans]SFR26126.1 hypothetical protein SAMN03159514_04869 [Kosakonia radicincitans]SFU16543.1 hypothetical protein SAMN03159428_04882 [Kosakonia radicincitans]SFY31709.1 hypothetical protein SAMN03159436_04859 [Kosakonia radicincitans]